MSRKLLLAALATLAMMFVMRYQGAVLVTPQSPRGILDLEFANTPAKLQNLLGLWDHASVKWNIGLDFLFIAAYASFFSLLTQQTANLSTGFMRTAGHALSRLSWLAAILDVVENGLMWFSFEQYYSVNSLVLTYYCAFFKFVLVGLAILYLLLSVPAWLKQKQRLAGD